MEQGTIQSLVIADTAITGCLFMYMVNKFRSMESRIEELEKKLQEPPVVNENLSPNREEKKTLKKSPPPYNDNGDSDSDSDIKDILDNL